MATLSCCHCYVECLSLRDAFVSIERQLWASVRAHARTLALVRRCIVTLIACTQFSPSCSSHWLRVFAKRLRLARELTDQIIVFVLSTAPCLCLWYNHAPIVAWLSGSTITFFAHIVKFTYSTRFNCNGTACVEEIAVNQPS